jgi:hypothetical protein
MTQNQTGSTEQRLALNVCYGIIGTLGIAILCRDFCDTDDRVGVSSRARRRPRDPLRHDCGARDLPPVSPNRIWRVIITAAVWRAAAFHIA